MGRIRGGVLFQDGQAAVLAAVVDVNDLPGMLLALQGSVDGLVKEGQVFFFVVDGDHEGKMHGLSIRLGGEKCQEFESIATDNPAQPQPRTRS